MLWCRRCEKEYPADELFCPVHVGEELIERPAEPAAADIPADDDEDQPRTVCWNCGHRSENATNATCSVCHESLVPPALIIDFPDGSVRLARGTSADLGRAGEYDRVFARHPNVSGRHATATVDAQGDAWITPNPAAPNGTFVNDAEIFQRTQVQPADRIRFATDTGPNPGPVSTRIRQPQRAREHGGD